MKGGGKGMPTINPYGGNATIRPQSGAHPLSFNDFIQKTNHNATAPNKLPTKPSGTLLLGNANAPIIKPEF